MSSQSLNYLDYKTFSQLLFSTVEEQLNFDSTDPLPDFRRENSENLEKILGLIQNNTYYPTLSDKAAYLFVSIIEGHIYSNGNKRLATVAFLYFLITNGYKVKFKGGELAELSLYIADKKRNKDASFDDLKAYTTNFLQKHI